MIFNVDENIITVCFDGEIDAEQSIKILFITRKYARDNGIKQPFVKFCRQFKSEYSTDLCKIQHYKDSFDFLEPNGVDVNKKLESFPIEEDEYWQDENILELLNKKQTPNMNQLESLKNSAETKMFVFWRKEQNVDPIIQETTGMSTVMKITTNYDHKILPCLVTGLETLKSDEPWFCVVGLELHKPIFNQINSVLYNRIAFMKHLLPWIQSIAAASLPCVSSIDFYLG